MKVIEYKFGGNSFPIIVEKADQKFLIKLRAGMSGEYSLLSEWFGNVIGKIVGINTRQPNWVILSDSLMYNNVYIEVRDLIEKSMGLNISFKYIENAKDFLLSDLENIKKEKFIDVYLLDVLLLNIDRTEVNVNLLKNDKDDLVVSDFESSLFFNELLNQSVLSKNDRILQCLRSHPFYQKIGSEVLDSFVNRLNDIDFDFLIFDLPDGLLTIQKKEKLLLELAKKKLSHWGLREILNRIDNISLETEEEKKARIKSNRDKLEKLVSSTQDRR